MFFSWMYCRTYARCGCDLNGVLSAVIVVVLCSCVVSMGVFIDEPAKISTNETE